MRFDASDPSSELSRLQTAQALVLTYLITRVRVDGKRALDVWAEIYEPTRFLVDESDDPSFPEYLKLIQEVYGEEFSPLDVEDEEKLTRFIKLARNLKGKILSSPATPLERLSGWPASGSWSNASSSTGTSTKCCATPAFPKGSTLRALT